MYNTLMGVEVVTITPLGVYWQHPNYYQLKAGCNGNTPFLTVYGVTTKSAVWDIEIQGRRLRMIDLPGSFDPGRNKVQDLSDDG